MTDKTLHQESKIDVYSKSKAFYHADRIAAIQRGEMIAPTELQIDLEAFCNDNCTFCSYRAETGYNTDMLELLKIQPNTNLKSNFPIGKPSDKSRINYDVAMALPRQMKEAGIPSIEITGGGEPTLWPGFDAFITELARQEIEIALVTNGSTMPETRLAMLAKYLTWIRFSMDAATSDTHYKVHRTSNMDFNRRLDNIKDMVKMRDFYNRKDKFVIGVSYLVTPENIGEIELAINLYKNMGVDNIRFTWMYDKTGKAGLDDQQINYAKEYITKRANESQAFAILFDSNRIDDYSQPNDDFNKCYMQRFVWAIGADSKVYPCCIMKYNTDYAWADIRDKTLKQIIEDPFVKEKVMALNPATCYPCWFRGKNKIIGSAVDKPIHANFV